MLRYASVLLAVAVIHSENLTAFAQQCRGGSMSSQRLLGSTGQTGRTNGAGVNMDSFYSNFAQSQQRFANFVAQRQLAAAIQGARAKQQFARYVATKQAYRKAVIAEAERLGTEPRWSKREQRRIKLLAKTERKKQERMTYIKRDRSASQIRPVTNFAGQELARR